MQILDRLKCKLGLHDFEYFTMAINFQLAFPEMVNVGRTCRICNRLEYRSDDNRKWQVGAWGELRTVPVGQVGACSNSNLCTPEAECR